MGLTMGMRRLFIIRKDLHLSAGKLGAMVAHCAEGYWIWLIRKNLTEVDGRIHSGWTKMAKAAALLESGSNLFRMMLPIASVRSISFIRVRIEYRVYSRTGKSFRKRRLFFLIFPFGKVILKT